MHNSNVAFEGSLRFLRIVFDKFFIFIHLYFPGYLPGQELAPSSSLKGCQRVFEPDLSPLLYKSKYAFAEID
jgi:hypothetical protein